MSFCISSRVGASAAIALSIAIGPLSAIGCGGRTPPADEAVPLNVGRYESAKKKTPENVADANRSSAPAVNAVSPSVPFTSPAVTTAAATTHEGTTSTITTSAVAPSVDTASAITTTAPATQESSTAKSTTGEEWNCFRGAHSGVSSWNNAPADWEGASGRGVIWKTPLGASCTSSPIVWHDHLYITESTHTERAVLAFDVHTGKQLWRKVVEDGGAGSPLPSVADAALALPTPAADSNHVYALFGTGDLACFSHDGKLLWKVFLQRPVIGYGYSSSPAIANGKVFVQLDGQENGRVVLIDGNNGKTLWEKERSRGASWSSPIVIPGPAGTPLWVANANGSITAFDAKGTVAWDLDGVTGQVTPSPSWADGRLYLLNVGASLLCYSGDASPKLLWDYKKSLSDTSSPVVTNGLLFMSVTGGIMVCVDAATGQQQWKQRGPGAYASIVSSGPRVYCLGRDGTMLIFAAERAYRELAICQLGDGADATPAMGDGRMVIRSNHFLWCMGK